MIPMEESAFRRTAALFSMSALQFKKVLARVAKRFRTRIMYVKDENMAIGILRSNVNGLTIGTVVHYGTHEVEIVE